ncbi:MAG: hypothetical protein ACYSUX_06250 [Planctomycetota bacterium]|jgi:hypothetical protein
MPSPKSGKAGNVVPPTAPNKAEDADVADPGEVAEIKSEQAKTKSGKYGSQEAKPFKPPAAEEQAKVAEEGKNQAKNEQEEEKKASWIEIELVGEDDQGIPGEKYKITLPDESVAEGTLDEKGFARIEGFEEGTCKVCFPDIDKEAWEKI